MSKEYVSKHSKPEGKQTEQKKNVQKNVQQGSAAPKKSAGIIILLLLIILAAAGVLVYLAVNVFQIELPFLSKKAEATPVPTAALTPEPTVAPTAEPLPEPTQAPAQETVYTAEKKTLDNSGSYINADSWTENGLYASSWKIAEDGYSYVYQISNIDRQGNKTLLGSYKTMDGLSNTENWNNYFSSATLTAVSAASDGNPVALECVSSSGEKTEGETTQNLFTTSYFARKLDANGAELSKAELVYDDPDDNLSAKAFRVSSEGNYILLTNNGTAMFGPEGVLLSVATTDGSTDSMVRLSDGRMGIVTWDMEGQKMNALSTDGSMFEDIWDLPDSACAFADGAGRYLFFYSTGLELYGLDEETMETVKILNWSASDISGIRVDGLMSQDGTNFICLTNQPDSNGQYTSCIVNLTVASEAETAQRQELILATVSPMEDLQDAVAEYNSNSSGTRILLKTFEMGDTEEATLEALKQFVEEELDGKMPDLIDMTGMPYEEMAASGMLEDLYPYLDADAELGRDMILPQVLSALEINGKLCTTCSGFSLSTVIGPKSTIGEQNSWNFDQYDSVTATLGEGVSVFDGYTVRDTVLYEELGLNSDIFINWNDLTCDFNNEQFRKLLSFVKSVPDTVEDPESISIANGNQFLQRTTLFSYDDIILAANDFNQNEVYIGFPAAEGSGTGMNLYKEYAMTTACADKQAAWQFLRTFFTESYQTGDDFWHFPSNRNAFETGLAAAKQVKTDASGNSEARAVLVQEDKDPQYFYQLTDAMAVTVQNLVNQAKGSCCSEAVYNLVAEAAYGYLNGGDTAENASAAVQDAVSGYLAGLKQ